MDPKIYVDWSLRRGCMVLFGDSDEYKIYPSLAALLDDLKEPHRIILESTFSSFVLDDRREFMERCEREGHELLTLPTRETPKWRRRLGLDDKSGTQTYEDDLKDCKSMRAEVKAGAHLKKPALPDEAWITKRQKVNKELMLLRSTGQMKKRPRSEGYTFTSNKELYAQDLADKLPSFKTQPPVRQAALGDSAGKNYNLTILAAAGKAAEHARSTREFDRLAGTFAHAYGSQIRSDLMLWGYAGGGSRPKINKTTGRRDDITRSDYRRELRWLYHQLKSVT